MGSSNNQIEEIKNKLDIVQVVEKYVKLKRAGKNYAGLCPFHTEKTPSFIVSPDLQRYKCFGCGETGDIFNFVQKIENIDFPEALEKLAKQAGVELKKRKISYRYKTLEEINHLATKYYYNQLKNDKNALNYLTERGFTAESIKQFAIGYAPKKPQLRSFLFKTKAFTSKELLESGLFVKKNAVLKEKFYDRIMFPIRSRKGTVIAFTGRILPKNKWGPKYMNSPETPIFQKRDNVFGQYESRQEIRKNDLIIMCEGSTDVISAHQHGIKNIVAPLGTSLTTEQLQYLSNMSKNFLFIFDSDTAGQNALIRAFKIASELKLNPYATDTSPYKDIDELLLKKPKDMKRRIENKKEAFSFILSNYTKDKSINRLEDMNKIKNLINILLESVKDKTTKELYIKKVKRIYKIDLDKTTNIPGKGITKNPTEIKQQSMEIDKIEEQYIQHLLLLPKLNEKQLVPLEYITSKELIIIYNTILKNRGLSKEELFNRFQNQNEVQRIFENLIFRLSDLPSTKEIVEKEIMILKKRIVYKFLKSKQKELTVKIALAEENRELKSSEKHLKELMDINNLLKQNDYD